MLSPDDFIPKTMAPSIWSFDSGYASNNVSSEQLLPMREETALDPLFTKLSVFPASDSTADEYFFPGIPSKGEQCIACSRYNLATPKDGNKCNDCQIPHIPEPASYLRMHTPPSRTKLAVPRLEIPQEPESKDSSSMRTIRRCSACDLSSLIKSSNSPTSCTSCTPNPDLLSPISPISPAMSFQRVKRSRAGRSSKLPLAALHRLQSWLDANRSYPYPDSDTKKLLAQECGITEKQVTTWFTNARARRMQPSDTLTFSSGSEDEDAQEADIASLTNTPIYAGPTSFSADNRQSGYRRAGSVSGSSVFSPTQARHQPPSRRGKKKDYRRKSQMGMSPDPSNEVISPVQPTSATTTQGSDGPEMWQCTFCRRHLVPKSWRRHEETQHRPKSQWTCMLYGPRLSFPVRSNSSSVCAFCMEKNPTEEHFLHNHRISECAKRSVGERTFYRPDHLRQHVKNFHGATLFDIVQARWKKGRDGDAEEEGWTCGFCGDELETWDKRETHIANHFKEGMTMDSWKEYPKPKSTKKGEKCKHDNNNNNHEKGHQHHHNGLARLARGLTRRSSRRTEQNVPAQSQPQMQTFNYPQTTFTNPFDPLPSSTGLGISMPPVLPNINLDPLMMDGFDWNDPTSSFAQPQYNLTTAATFDPSVFPTTAYTSAFDPDLNLGLYGEPLQYQGPWDPQQQQQQHQQQQQQQHQHPN